MTNTRVNSGWFLGLVILLSSCAKDFVNPYDPATPADIWMPSELTIDTLGRNALRLSWQQDELHIDGYTVRRDVSGQISEFTIPFDSLTFSDIMVVDSTVTDTCPAVLYSVMARAGENLSDSLASSAVVLPIVTEANAGADQSFTDNTTQTTLSANSSGIGETGQWSVVSGDGGSFSDASSPTTTFTGQACAHYVLRWTISGSCSSVNSDEVAIHFQQQTTQANAGADITAQTTIVSISANSPGANETGQWSILSGAGGVIGDINSAATTLTGSEGSIYMLQWTINGACSNSDDVQVDMFNLTNCTTPAPSTASGQLNFSLGSGSLSSNIDLTWTGAPSGQDHVWLYRENQFVETLATWLINDGEQSLYITPVLPESDCYHVVLGYTPTGSNPGQLPNQNHLYLVSDYFSWPP